MRTDDAPEFIEIIDDDTDAFGDHSQARSVPGSGGPRWVGPVAAVALVGLIGYGVVTSTGTPPKPAPASSGSFSIPTPPTFSPQATTTIAARPTLPYYAADPPDGYAVRFAEHQQFGSDFGLVDYQLWVSRDASATTGAWFSVTTYQGASMVYAPNAYRLQTGDTSIAMSHSAGGHALAQFTTADHTGVMIAALGWSDDALVRLAASVQADASGFDFTDTWFTADHHLLSTVEPWLAIRGVPLEQIGYSPSSNLRDALVLTIGQPPADDAGEDSAQRDTAMQFLLDGITPFTFDGHSGTAGTVIGDGNYSVANWLDGNNVITVGGHLPVSQLITVARTVHEVSAPEWTSMQSQVAAATSVNVDTSQTMALPVSFGTDSNSETWTINVSEATYGDRRQINWTWGPNSGGTEPLGTAQINTVVADHRTYVLADLPRAVAATAELHVFRDALDPMVIPFLDLLPSYDRTFAAFAFSETGAYSAEITGPDGAVLTTWPSS